MTFALKEFKDRPSRSEADFKKELLILDELRIDPHRNIVTHLATWTQDERFYILFPYAECNLREYMRERPFGKPTNQNVLWLLLQFLGLADALRVIHNMESPSSSVDTNSGLLAPAQQARKSAWHHDLKPENLLYYREPGAKHGRFVIADFGSGKVSTYRSGSINTHSATGTPTYEPPEAEYEGATSRPYDVWSMGCVFLELLIWAVLGLESLEEFEGEREDKRFPDAPSASRDDSFWQFTGKKFQLRASVLLWFRKLSEADREELEPFQAALQSVRDLVMVMLNTDRERRIKAVNLWNTLESVYKQTKRDLGREQQEPFLLRLSMKAYEEQRPEPSSPTQIVHRTKSPVSRASNPSMDPDYLLASPRALSSARGHGRNTSVSVLSDFSEARTRERSISDVSSTHVQDGSSLHSQESRRPSIMVRDGDTGAIFQVHRTDTDAPVTGTGPRKG